MQFHTLKPDNRSQSSLKQSERTAFRNNSMHIDNREQTTQLKRLEDAAGKSPQIMQLKMLKEVAKNSSHVKRITQLRDLSREMHGTRPVQDNTTKLNPKLPSSNSKVVQRAINVELITDTANAKTLRAKGKVKDFKGGSGVSTTKGWINVTSYRSSNYIYDKGKESHYASSRNLQNIFTEPHRGHILGKQNGGAGWDSENILAQDGGANTRSYLNFENEMRGDLDDAAATNKDKSNSKVTFTSYLVGKNIKEGVIQDEALDDAMAIDSESD